MKKLFGLMAMVLFLSVAAGAQQDSSAQYREAVRYLLEHKKAVLKKWEMRYKEEEYQRISRQDTTFCISRLILYDDLSEFADGGSDSLEIRKLEPVLFDRSGHLKYDELYSFKPFLSTVLDSNACCKGYNDPAQLTFNFSRPIRNYLVGQMNFQHHVRTLSRSLYYLQGRALEVLFIFDEQDKIRSVSYAYIDYN